MADVSSSFNIEDPIDKLSYGLSHTYLPDMVKSKQLLTEVTDSQRVIIDTLQQENAKFNDCPAFNEVNQTMERARIYQAKLINIKKDMLSVHERTTQLKKRALRLQQQKQKEVLQAELQRERELEKERQLIAKDVSNKKS